MILIIVSAMLTAMAQGKQGRQLERRAAETLRGLGARPTRQRVTVLTELMGEKNDLTAQELHQRLRSRGSRLGLATVYRTLGLLSGEGASTPSPTGPARSATAGAARTTTITSCLRTVTA
jgi:Ferric uptake regulator family